jgi:iron complex transport system ATP-binding protein
MLFPPENWRAASALLSGYRRPYNRCTILFSLGRYPYTDWAGHLGGEDHAVVARCIRSVGAEDLAYSQICELSDGERQKVMVAREFPQQPRLMILDEITAFLDFRAGSRSCACFVDLRTSKDARSCCRPTTSIWRYGVRIVFGPCPRQVRELPMAPPHGSTRVRGRISSLLAPSSGFLFRGIKFDRHVGHFRLQEATAGYARVLGEGTHALWTARVMQQWGYDTKAIRDTSLSAEVTSEFHQTV